MIVPLEEAFGSLLGQILSIVVFIASIGCVPLLAWAGTRLTMKIVNRGVGK